MVGISGGAGEGRGGYKMGKTTYLADVALRGLSWCSEGQAEERALEGLWVSQRSCGGPARHLLEITAKQAPVRCEGVWIVAEPARRLFAACLLAGSAMAGKKKIAMY